MSIPEPNTSEIFAFLRDLTVATRSGEVSWSSRDQGGTSFSLVTPAGTVYLSSLSSQGHPYRVSIYDAEERELFEVTTELGGWYNDEERLIEDLHTAVRESLFDVSGTIRQMRRLLNLS